MEYARHKRHRRRTSNRKNSHGGNGEAGRALLALIMIAAIVYLVSASTAGTWIANKVVVPVFSVIDDIKSMNESKKESANEEKLNEAVTASESIQQVSLDDTKQAIDMEVTLPAITCYAVQMGVYSSPANAQAQALVLQNSGAGGYVLNEGARYRVLSAGYSQKEQAANARDGYLGKGIDCTVYTLSTNEARYRVSALEEQMGAVTAGFASISKAQQSLSDAVSAYDSGMADINSGKEKLRDISETLKNEMALLSGYEGGHAALSDLVECYEDCLAAIENAAKLEAQSADAFAANLKHT